MWIWLFIPYLAFVYYFRKKIWTSLQLLRFLPVWQNFVLALHETFRYLFNRKAVCEPKTQTITIRGNRAAIEYPYNNHTYKVYTQVTEIKGRYDVEVVAGSSSGRQQSRLDLLIFRENEKTLIVGLPRSAEQLHFASITAYLYSYPRDGSQPRERTFLDNEYIDLEEMAKAPEELLEACD